MSRPTLVSIEKGVRRVRIQEIQMLARRYGVSVNAEDYFRREAVHTDLMPRFRKLREAADAHTTEAVQLFNDLIKADVEMENILGIRRRRNYPPERGINEGDVVALAEKYVKELRDWLGLGPGPILQTSSRSLNWVSVSDCISVVSTSSSKVSGLSALMKMSACILLNANHPLPRRTQSASHQVGHFYGTRQILKCSKTMRSFLTR